eukprot:scaffold8075_cov115-Isochrysis_galbana.AAC.9
MVAAGVDIDRRDPLDGRVEFLVQFLRGGKREGHGKGQWKAKVECAKGPSAGGMGRVSPESRREVHTLALDPQSGRALRLREQHSSRRAGFASAGPRAYAEVVDAMCWSPATLGRRCAHVSVWPPTAKASLDGRRPPRRDPWTWRRASPTCALRFGGAAPHATRPPVRRTPVTSQHTPSSRAARSGRVHATPPEGASTDPAAVSLFAVSPPGSSSAAARSAAGSGRRRGQSSTIRAPTTAAAIAASPFGHHRTDRTSPPSWKVRSHRVDATSQSLTVPERAK